MFTSSKRPDETLQWRDVPGFIGRYAVSEMGDVWSLPRRKSNGHRTSGGLMSQARQKHGYLMVGLIKDGRAYPETVHRIVCRSFNGPQPEGKPWVLHGDGNTSNNRIDNLRWGTPKENVQDSIEHGTFYKRPRGNVCSAGHERTENNTRTYEYGQYCMECAKISHVTQRKARLERGLETADPRHGTIGGYSNWGCKCGDCMEAKRLHQIKRRAELKEMRNG